MSRLEATIGYGRPGLKKGLYNQRNIGYEANEGQVSLLVGALSPVNHKGSYQGLGRFSLRDI